MPFTLPALPYPADALAPTIDAETMSLHHDKHHQAYIDKINAAVAEDPALAGKSIEALLASASSLPDPVRGNAGGHWNHSFFWEAMKPGGGAPSGALRQAIDAEFGSLDDFKTRFNEAGVGRFGSGWVWLIVGASGGLEIVSTPNQDNPLMDDAPDPGTPILGNDLWEHAYYLTYRNRRPDYLKAWWDIVDWDRAAERYAEAVR